MREIFIRDLLTKTVLGVCHQFLLFEILIKVEKN
jgi:hypothetical protein